MAKKSKPQWTVMRLVGRGGTSEAVGSESDITKAMGLALRTFASRANTRPVPSFLRVWVIGPDGKPTGTLMEMSYTEERR